MHKEHFQAIKSLRSNEQILITKPDKGSGVVILNKSDYIQKLGYILDDKTKFFNMGSVDQHDNTAKTEQKLQKRLLDLVNQKILTRDIYDRIRPTGLTAPTYVWLTENAQRRHPTSAHFIYDWLLST